MAWLLGIFALLALPLIWWLAPPLRLPILRPEEAIATAAAFATPAGAMPPVPAGAPGWSLILLAFYLIGAAAVMLRFALSRHLVSRLWREAEPARDADWQKLLARLSREIGLSRPAQLSIARGPAQPMTWGPMTWGTLTPRILLPAEARLWPAERRQLVLLHELAHVARRDSFGRSVASLACALYWFHPGAWFAARRMRLEQEYAADDRVLNAGAGPRRYARSLLDLALSAGEPRWPDHTAAMAGMCQLERRVVSITGTARREAPGAAFHAASAAITALTVLAVAAALPVRPLPALSGSPAIETTLPSAEAVSAPAEGRSESEALVPRRANMVPRGDDRSGERRNGFEEVRAEIPPSQAERRVLEAGGPQAGPTAPGHAPEAFRGAPAGQDFREPPAPAPRRVVYGPQLPQPAAEPQDSDPRIPEALRRGGSGRSGNAGRAGDRGTGSRSRAVGLRILPGVILSPGQIWP